MVNLIEVNNIRGVLDSFLYNKWGELLIPQLHYNDERIYRLGKEVAFCSAFLEKIEKELDFIELIYEGSRIIIRIASNFSILVICEEKADIPLIKLTVNVLMNQIKSDREMQRLLRKTKGEEDPLIEAQQYLGWKELFEKISH